MSSSTIDYQKHLKNGWKSYLEIFISSLSIKEIPLEQQLIIDKCFENIDSGNMDSISFELIIHRLVFDLNEQMIVWKMIDKLTVNQLLARGPLYLYLISLPDINVCIEEIQRLIGSLLEPSYSLVYYQSDQNIIIEPKELVAEYLASEVKSDTALCVVLYIMRALAGVNFDYQTIYVPNKRLNFDKKYALLYTQANIVFHDGPMLATFPAEQLVEKNIAYNKIYSTQLKNQVSDLLLTFNPSITLSEQAKKHMLTVDKPAKQTIDSVALNFGLSQATFRRKLKSENTCFTDIQNEILKSIYLKALLSSNMSIESLALKIGYSERSSFERSFFNKFGLSPSKYRKAYQKSAPTMT